MTSFPYQHTRKHIRKGSTLPLHTRRLPLFDNIIPHVFSYFIETGWQTFLDTVTSTSSQAALLLVVCFPSTRK